MKRNFENGNTYANKLYKLLTYSKVTVRTIPVKEYRELLGVPAGTYASCDYLLIKYTVYEPVKTINKKTSLKVRCEEIKRGKDTVAIKFTVSYPEAGADKTNKMEFCAEPQKTSTTSDPVSHPSHYTDGRIEVIDFIQDKGLNFCRGNIVKYVARAGKKGDKAKEIEDLKKARQYCDFEINRLEGRV